MTGISGGFYSDHLSITGLQRLHTEARLGHIGDERVKHLTRVQFGVKEAIKRYKGDPKLDHEQWEMLERLDLQVDRDLIAAKQHATEMMPDDDQSLNEP